MGTRGPVPKRSDVRAGHRAKSDQPDQAPAQGRVRIPAADRAWHPQALRWYQSLRRSGQHRYFEPSDWAEAHLLADLLTRELTAVKVVQLPTGDQVIVPVPPRALMTKTILATMNELGTTESSRRRMRIEVNRTALSDNREATGAGNSDDALSFLDDYRERGAGG